MIQYIEWNVKQIKWILAMIKSTFLHQVSLLNCVNFANYLSTQMWLAQVQSIFITIKLILETHTILKQMGLPQFHSNTLAQYSCGMPIQLCSADGIMM